jgi:hypothetical protein
MLFHQAILRLHHVVIVVFRKTGAQSVGGLGRLPRPDGVGQNEEVRGGVERLTRPEKFAGEVRAQKSATGAVGTMENQNRLTSARPHCYVVQAQFRQRFASVKTEVADHPVAFDGGRVIGGADQGRSENKGKQGAGFHGDLLANSTFSYIRSAGRRCRSPGNRCR